MKIPAEIKATVLSTSNTLSELETSKASRKTAIAGILDSELLKINIQQKANRSSMNGITALFTSTTR
jgi:hypothetical protein